MNEMYVNNTTSLENNKTSMETPESSLGVSIDDGMVSAGVYLTTFNVIQYAVYPLLFLGVLCGIFSVAVFSSKAMRSATSIFLVALNMAEICCGVCGLIMVFFGSEGANNGNHTNFTITIYTSIYFNASFRRTTYCFSCLLSIERCIAVVFPLRVKNSRMIRYPITVVISMVTISLTTHLYTLFKYEIAATTNPQSNETVWKLQDHPVLIRNRELFSILSHVTQFIFVYLPLLFCLVFNTVTAVSLRRHQIHRRKLFESSANDSSVALKHRNTTVVVVVSTFVLVVLALPINIKTLIATFGNTELRMFGKEHYLYLILIAVGHFCEVFINCSGFLFYMVIGKHFRETFIQMFCSSCKKKSQETSRKFENVTTNTDSDSTQTDNNSISVEQ